MSGTPASPVPLSAGRWSPRWTNVALVLLGAISLLLYCKGAHDQGQKRITTFTAGALGLAIPYFVASWMTLRARPARSTFLIVLGFALLFRIVCLNTEVYLSTDLYRYVWDGRVQAAHINPYRYIPADKHLAFLRDKKIYPNVNRRTYAKTVYPPGAQIIYLAVTRISESVTCIRITMVAFEALTIWALVRLLATFGLPAQRALLYGWHPLIVWEFAGGGHVDAAMIAFVVLALLLHRLNRPVSTGVALAVATLTKLFPLILAPALYRQWRWSWKMPAALIAVVVLGYAPYVLTYHFHGALGFLPRYTNEEGLQSGDRFFLLSLLPADALAAVGLPAYNVFVALGLLAAAGTVAWAVWRPETDGLSYLRRSLCMATLFVVLLSSGVDWYATWLVPFLCFLPYPWLFWLTASSLVLYLNWVHTEPADIYLLNAAIYFPAAFLGLYLLARRWVAGRKTRSEGGSIRSPETMLAEN
jgi:alpha-1,6-mannosyltransferase